MWEGGQLDYGGEKAAMSRGGRVDVDDDDDNNGNVARIASA